MYGSNLRFFLIAALLLLHTLSCNREKNDVIPDIRIDFVLTASDPEFFDLFNAPGTSVLITSAHRHLGIGTGGYDGNGIIIYNTGNIDFNEFAAFDRTCPHCYATDEVSVAIDIDGVLAECPRCSTLYALGSSGQPLQPNSGPGRYYLKNYHTRFSGYTLRVWNK